MTTKITQDYIQDIKMWFYLLVYDHLRVFPDIYHNISEYI